MNRKPVGEYARLSCLVMQVLASGSFASEFAFVQDGKPCACICQTADRQVNEDIAFFTNAVFRMTGAAVKVERADDARGGNRVVFDVREADLFHEDNYGIAFQDAKTLKIVGTSQSCRWALNRILDQQGVVFCFPGIHGTHWPRRTDVVFRSTAPVIRGTSGLKLQRQLYAEDPLWERCLNGKTYRGNFQNHSMCYIFPRDKYGTEEWMEKIMPVQNGKRVHPTRWDVWWQPCFASQVTVDEAVKNICSAFERDPSLKVFSLSVNDLEGYCTCDACKRLNGGSLDRRTRFGFGASRDHSPIYYAWANKVAEGVVKRYPKALLGCLAYCGTIDPPPFKLHPAIVPFLCQDLSKLRDPKELQKRRDLVAAWQEKAASLGFWDYGYGCHCYSIPRLYVGLQETFFRMKEQYPCIQSYFCEGSSFMGEGPKRYLYYRFMWDPQLDVSAELDKWCRACVGDAAAPMLREYYQVWEDFWSGECVSRTRWYVKGLKGLYFCFDDNDYVLALRREELDRASALMEQVVAAAGRSGDAEQRIRAARLAEFHGFYRNRIVSCGAFHSEPDGSFATAAQAAGFVRALGEIGEAQRNMEACARRVCASKFLDQGDFNLTPHACKSFTNLLQKTSSMTLLFNSLLDHMEAPEVVSALRESVRDRRLDAERARILRGLLAFDSLPNLAQLRAGDAAGAQRSWHRLDHKGLGIDVRPDEDGVPYHWRFDYKRGWSAAGKIVLGLRKSHNYLFSADMTNTTKRQLDVQLIFGSRYDDQPDGQAGRDGGHESERRYRLKPGETKTLRLFGKTSPRVKGAHVYVCPSLVDGESVRVKNVLFKDIECESD